MNCNKLRDLLIHPEGPLIAEGGQRHLEDCADCRRFADRLRTARELLENHHGNVEPDAAFAARVVTRLPQGSAELLGRAAARLIPATLALVLVLAWFAYRADPVQTVAEESVPTEDLVSWVLDQSGEAP